MKILVLGANGRTGKHIVSQGLSRGHEIVALVRNPETMQAQDGLTCIKGSPINASDLIAANQGCDAIIVTLNNPRTSDAPWAKPITTDKILTQVSQNIISLGDQRVVYLSAVGVGDSFESSPWIMRFMIRRTNLKYAYEDHNLGEKTFRDSGARWTLVRPVGLSNSTKEKSLIVGTGSEPKPGMMIRRSSVASFMLDCVENNSHLLDTPVISEK